TELSGELLTVSMRYKNPDEAESRLIEVPVEMSSYNSQMADYTRFAAAVAQFAMYLRGDEGMQNLDLYALVNDLADYTDTDSEYFEEFRNIISAYLNR
ncbi:MAG: YfbK domain-containing protein, partial [Hominimerdicola sp.]